MPRKKTFAAIRVRGVAQFDSAVNLQGNAVTPVEEYIAIVQQADTNHPNVDVIHNSLGADITWTRTGVGFYQGASTKTFYQQNTVVNIDAFPQNGSPVFGCRAYILAGNIIIHTFTVSDGSNVDAVLPGTPIRIEVYDIPFTIPPPEG